MPKNVVMHSTEATSNQFKKKTLHIFIHLFIFFSNKSTELDTMRNPKIYQILSNQ